MPNPTQADILSAIGTLIDGVSDTGLVLTDGTFIENEQELANLFRAKNDGVIKGWLVVWAGIPEQVEDGTCDVAATFKYDLFTLYPYDSTPDGDGKNSQTRFNEMIEDVNHAFNEDRYLGLTSQTQHQFLKSTEDFAVYRFETGTASVLVHYATFELLVSVINRY